MGITTGNLTIFNPRGTPTPTATSNSGGPSTPYVVTAEGNPIVTAAGSGLLWRYIPG